MFNIVITSLCVLVQIFETSGAPVVPSRGSSWVRQPSAAYNCGSLDSGCRGDLLSHVKLTLATVDVVGNDYVDTITTTSLIKNDMTYIYAIIDLTYKFEPILDDFVTFMQI
jgi:hypothetical protein